MIIIVVRFVSHVRFIPRMVRTLRLSVDGAGIWRISPERIVFHAGKTV